MQERAAEVNPINGGAPLKDGGGRESECLALTLSFPGTRLVHVLAVAIPISPNNGPIEMIPSGILIYYVPPIHFACSIM
jgi:hypothetical protein